MQKIGRKYVSKRICQWCGKPFIAQKTTTCYFSPQCSKRGYKHRMMERKMELRHMQEMQELRSSLEKQEYFTFFAGCTSVSPMVYQTFVGKCLQKYRMPQCLKYGHTTISQGILCLDSIRCSSCSFFLVAL